MEWEKKKKNNLLRKPNTRSHQTKLIEAQNQYENCCCIDFDCSMWNTRALKAERQLNVWIFRNSARRPVSLALNLNETFLSNFGYTEMNTHKNTITSRKIDRLACEWKRKSQWHNYTPPNRRDRASIARLYSTAHFIIWIFRAFRYKFWFGFILVFILFAGKLFIEILSPIQSFLVESDLCLVCLIHISTTKKWF